MNKSMKKKALISSILTIALCLSVIAGATFALFTSDSAVNIAITSGKVNLVANIVKESLKTSSLGVEQQPAGTFAAGGAAAFDVEGDDLVLTGVLPGDKATFDIKVTNNSNVDIQYKVKWTVNGELMGALVAKADGNDLTDVTWTPWTTAMDKEDTIEVSVELPRETGNEYQNKGARITFAVEAVQANAIAESVTTADQLVTALENGTGSVTLMNDITVDETIDIPADAVTTLNLNGKSITSTGTLINNDGVLTIAGDGVLDVSAATEKSQVINNYGNLTLKGGTYKGTEVIYSYAIRNYATMTADDANLIGGFGGISLGGGTKTVINDGDYAITGDGGAHTVYLYEDAELTVNGGNFYEALAEKRTTYSYTFYLNGADTKVTVNGGNIAGMNMPAGVTVNGGSGTFVINGGTVNGKLTAAKTVIYGGTFDNDPTSFVAEYFVVTPNNGVYTVAQDPMVFFVKDDAELAAALATIKADSNYWDVPTTVVLAAGIYSDDYAINQYPEWNGIVGAGGSGNNITSIAGNERVAPTTFVGTGDVIFTGNVTVNGFGNANSTDDFSVVTAAATKFENVAFDASTHTDDEIALYVKAAASNVTLSGCTFQNASHVTLGANGANRIGKVIIDGCEFINGNCLSGYVRTLEVTNSTATNAYNGFINVQGVTDLTVEDCAVDCGEYFVRTNANVNATVKDTEINVVEAGGLCVIANLRGANTVVNFVDCDLNTVATKTVAGAVVKINGVEQKKSETVTSNEKLEDAIADGNNVIVLDSGNYIIPDSAQGKTISFIGNGETVVATQDDGSYEGCDYSLDGATAVFEGIVITTDSSTYTGYARLNATYNNCTINGTYTLYGDSVFNNCTFNVSGDVYNIWTWGAPTAEFNNCTFNTSGKAILLYGGANTKLVVNNCVFNDDNAYSDVNNKAAIEVGSDWTTDTKEIIVTKATVNGFDVTNKGISTGTTLWGNKNSLPTSRLNVVVDGVDVY